MHTQKLTDTEIAIRIVPKRLRWPEAGRTAAWTKAHDCVDALRLESVIQTAPASRLSRILTFPLALSLAAAPSFASTRLVLLCQNF